MLIHRPHFRVATDNDSNPMNVTLQAERDLRARIKARLDHGCIRENCSIHGPADANDIMLVSCIYMSEHIRHYGTAAGLTTKAQQVQNTIPWKLPDPPVGVKWHREDWTQDMLPDGWRPLHEGEGHIPGDEWLNENGSWSRCTVYSAGPAKGYSTHYRTRRPLPQPADPVGVKAETEADWVPRSQFNALLESRAGVLNKVAMLAAERDSALAKLASFQWKPVSTPPTNEDAVNGMVWFLSVRGTMHFDSIRFSGAFGSGYTHWMTPIPLPTVPAETETEEQKMRREFDAHCSNRFPNGIALTMKEEFWTTWQAALESRNGKENP